MAFLDEQKVGPCGHSARDKEILIKVYSSCLSSQVPRKLSFSIHGCKNDNKTGNQRFCVIECIRNRSKIADGQHTIGVDFTEIQCSNKNIESECVIFPNATWDAWSMRERIYLTKGMDGDKPAWHYVLLVDSDDIILDYVEKTQGEQAGKSTIDVSNYGIILQSGFGEKPPQHVKDWLTQKYGLFQDDKF